MTRTRRLVGEFFECRDLGAIEIKGFEDPVQSGRCCGPAPPKAVSMRSARGSMTSLIGREDDWTCCCAIGKRQRRAGPDRHGARRTGIGKSRMVAALQERNRRRPAQPPALLLLLSVPEQHALPVHHPATRAAGFARDDTSQTKLDKLEALLGAGSERLGGNRPLCGIDGPAGARRRCAAALDAEPGAS